MKHSYKATTLLAAAAMTLGATSNVYAQETGAQANASASAEVQASFDIQAVIDFAGEKVAEVVLRLRAAGYEVVDMSRTLLGRVRLTVQNELHTRQMFISRATGEIKQDVVIATETNGGGQQQNGEGGATVSTQVTVGGSAGGNGGGISIGGSAGAGVSVGLGN